MADEPEAPDTLILNLSSESLDYKPGEVVFTSGAHYRIEQITHDSMHGKRMFLLRNDLVVKPIVQFDNNEIRVRMNDTTPENPKVI